MRTFLLLALLSIQPAFPGTLQLVEQHPAPVITIKSPGAEGIKYGFEGGRVVKVGRTYHSAKGRWSKEIRTPLGLVDEGDGTYTVFYTGFEQETDWPRLMEAKPVNTFAIGFARVRLIR